MKTKEEFLKDYNSALEKVLLLQNCDANDVINITTGHSLELLLDIRELLSEISDRTKRMEEKGRFK